MKKMISGMKCEYKQCMKTIKWHQWKYVGTSNSQWNEWEYFMVIWDEKNGHDMICKDEIQNDVKMIKLKWQCTEQVMANRMNENV